MRSLRFPAAAAAALLLSFSGASAHHVVWLDFSTFNLSGWASVNGNSPPTTADETAVQNLVIAYMVEDYAPFDIHFTTVQPAGGRYSRIRFLPVSAPGGLLGCAGPGCCRQGSCTGIGSWNNGVSQAEVYTWTLSLINLFTGFNATTGRIANGLAWGASHELGHLLSLRHCDAADDYFEATTVCIGDYGGSSDQNRTWHVMASALTAGWQVANLPTRDFFFNAHSERRQLYDHLQPRNHWAPLPNVNGGAGRSDLVYGRLVTPALVTWSAALSTTTDFNAATAWSAGAGQRADLFLTGDVTGDGRADLLYGRATATSTVSWTVHASTGSAFGAGSVWAADAGDAGDIFRLGDVDGDGDADLVYGRPAGGSTVIWFVRPSTGSSFGGSAVWASDAGNEPNLFLIGDVTGDGRADLVAAERGAAGDTEVYRSTGSGFVFAERDNISSFDPEYVLLGDADGDGRADLVTGQVRSSTEVDWQVRRSNGCGSSQCFLGVDLWANNAGDAGDTFRLGDGDGDGAADLFYGRPQGMLSLTAIPNLTLIRWFGRRSQGSSFGPSVTWASDLSDEGDIVP
jgi:hypothetical protein